MIEQLFGYEPVANTVGGIYIFIGITGSICNMATLLMITCYRMYRLSAYTIMANLALADTIMLIIAGLICGLSIIQVPSHNYDNAANNSIKLLNSSETILSLNLNDIFGHGHVEINSIDDQFNLRLNGADAVLENFHFSIFLLSFLEIAAWTAGIVSYALLGINRCVAICFYRTRAKAINRVSFALIGSTVTWLIGIVTACIGTMPVPLMGMRTDMWTVSFLNTAGRRPAVFMVLASFFNFTSILAQWSCSLMVLIKIHKVRHKINCNKLNIGSAKRFKKQIWLCNHMCNPFIYAYFNERMRLTYGQWLACTPLRECIHKCQKQYSRKHGEPIRTSKRLNATTQLARNSYWRNRSNRSDNFVRSSLQMQSRDFEQFCEVMMSVNTANDSSEGWTESSSDAEAEPIAATFDAAPQPSRRSNIPSGRGLELHSLVFDLGRQTVEHWANFAKKASL
uniref:G-protein coupled receptors family 1 profile domain-containing protein n=1 Tax=Setaria digitata TaxID=48799 RepID=A0A915PLH0_9BILA